MFRILLRDCIKCAVTHTSQYLEFCIGNCSCQLCWFAYPNIHLAIGSCERQITINKINQYLGYEVVAQLRHYRICAWLNKELAWTGIGKGKPDKNIIWFLQVDNNNTVTSPGFQFKSCISFQCFLKIPGKFSINSAGWIRIIIL